MAPQHSPIDPGEPGTARRQKVGPHFDPRKIGTRTYADGSTESYKLCVQGSVIEFWVKSRSQAPQPETCRGSIGDFTHQSRMRLLRFLNRIDWSNYEDSLFITLTYPDAVPWQKKYVRNMHRAIFLRFLEEFLGRHVSVIWRTEWKERLSGPYKGQIAPHHHFCLLGVKYVHFSIVNDWWKRAIRWKGFVSTSVKDVTGHQGALRYLSKYVAKAPLLDIGAYLNSNVEFGRHYGFCRKGAIRLHPVAFAGRVPANVAALVREVAAQRLAKYAIDVGGTFTLFGDDVAAEILASLSISGCKMKGG